MSPSLLVSAIPLVSLLYSPCLLLMLSLDDLMEKLGGSCFNLNDNDYDHIDSGKERVFKSVKSMTLVSLSVYSDIKAHAIIFFP
jgi:hypothetical protein